MQIIERDVGGVRVIELKRAFVVSDAPALAEAVRTRVARAVQRCQREVMLGFGRVSTVDSMGVGEVVRAHHQMCPHGGRLTLLRPSGRVLRLLHITKHVRIVNIRDTLKPCSERPSRDDSAPAGWSWPAVWAADRSHVSGGGRAPCPRSRTC